jgi:hypothetical protein
MTADLAERQARPRTDAALLAVVLAAPQYAERASLTEDRLWRVVRYIRPWERATVSTPSPA